MDTYLNSVSPILNALLGFTIKSSIILISAILVTRIVKQIPSAARHLIWSAVVASILVLPLFTLMLPAWYVPFPWLLIAEVTSQSAVQSLEMANDPGAATASTVSPAQLNRDGSQKPFSSYSENIKQPNVVTEMSILDETGRPEKKSSTSMILTSIWWAGILTVFLRQLFGRLMVIRMGWQAMTLSGTTWYELVDDLRQKQGLRRKVKLLISDKVSLPMTWGIIRPTVLLPAEAEGWNEEHRHYVLLHEMAHVKRWDCLTQLLIQLVTAIYWFNPLVWIAQREFLKEREHACDDTVLLEGSKASEYAGLLLNFAQSKSTLNNNSLATVAMARRSQIEGRLLAILDPGLRRQAVNSLAFAIITVAVLGMTLPLAAMQAGSIVEPRVTIDNYPLVPALADIPRVEPDIKVEPEEMAMQDEVPEIPAPVQRPTARKPTARQPDPIVQSLAEALSDSVLAVRLQAAETLGRMKSPEAMDALIAALDDENWQMRLELIDALSNYHDPSIVDPVLKYLKDDNWQVRAAAAETLGDYEDERTVERLGELLRDKYRQVRIEAADALGQIGDVKAVKPLSEALKDDDWEIRQFAAVALGDLENPAAIPSLKEALKDGHWEVRLAAIDALGEIESPEAIKPLGGMLESKDWEIRRAAIVALGEIEHTAAIEYLNSVIDDDYDEVRLMVVHALSEIHDPGIIPSISKMIKDPNWEIRIIAAETLGDLEDPSTVDVLTQALNDQNSVVRRTAAYSLAEIGDPRAVQPLITLLKDTDWEVRRMAAKALGEI